MCNSTIRRACLYGLATCAGLVPTVPAQALDVDWLVRAGSDSGGDTLISSRIGSGSDTYILKIKANQGLSISTGMTLTSDNGRFSTDISIGYKFEMIYATNQDSKFTRAPVELLAFYCIPFGTGRHGQALRIGGGPTYHLNPKFDTRGTLANDTVRYDNALGIVIQTDFRYRLFNIGLRYTRIDYDERHTTVTAKASGVGLFVSGMF